MLIHRLGRLHLHHSCARCQSLTAALCANRGFRSTRGAERFRCMRCKWPRSTVRLRSPTLHSVAALSPPAVPAPDRGTVAHFRGEQQDSTESVSSVRCRFTAVSLPFHCLSLSCPLPSTASHCLSLPFLGRPQSTPTTWPKRGPLCRSSQRELRGPSEPRG